MFKITRTLVSALLLLGLTLPASAAMIMTDDLTFTYDDSTLFGELIVVDSANNVVAFIPTEFSAVAIGAAIDGALDSVKVTITIKEDSDFVFPGVKITEDGDFVVGLPNGTDGVNSVRANMVTRNLNMDQMEDTFFEDEVTPEDPNDGNGQWEISTFHGGISELTTLEILIENSLTAVNTEELTQSFIDKKGVEITFVPVPAAVWLFGSVLATLGLFRKKAEATA